MASAARALHHYENMVSEGDWQEITQNDRSTKIRPAEWGQAPAHLEHDGTFVFLVSDNLTGDQLATLASGLRAAPNVGSIRRVTRTGRSDAGCCSPRQARTDTAGSR
jgi:hypothetical protein